MVKSVRSTRGRALVYVTAYKWMPIRAVLSVACREELFYKRLWEKAATHVFENIYVPSAQAGTVGYVLVIFVLYHIPVNDLNAIQANDTTSQNENSVSCFHRV